MSNDKSRRAEMIAKIKQQEAIEKEKKFQTRSVARAPRPNNDASIQSKITELLLGGGLTKILSVHAIVKSGTVTLYGNVPSPKIANRAIETARRIPGVKSVVSNLIVVEYKISPANTTKRIISEPQPNVSVRQPKRIAQPKSTKRTSSVRTLKPRKLTRQKDATVVENKRTLSIAPRPYIAPQPSAEALQGEKPLAEAALPWKPEEKTKKYLAPVTIRTYDKQDSQKIDNSLNLSDDSWEVPKFIK